MPTDMNIWRALVKQAVNGLADDAMQRRAWFGFGPEVSSPTEEICQLIDDTDFEEHLTKEDTGFTPNQTEAAKHLLITIKEFPFQIRNIIKPETLINDPRWIKIQQAAKQFLKVL